MYSYTVLSIRISLSEVASAQRNKTSSNQSSNSIFYGNFTVFFLAINDIFLLRTS